MKPKITRLILSFVLVAATSALSAADDLAVSKVTTNSLAEVRVVMESFCTQARTNSSLRPFVSASPSFWSGDIQAKAGGIRIPICDCGTTSACYEISATSVSPATTRIEVRSLDNLPAEHRAQFRPKRNARVMEELVRLLERKPGHHRHPTIHCIEPSHRFTVATKRPRGPGCSARVVKRHYTL